MGCLYQDLLKSRYKTRPIPHPHPDCSVGVEGSCPCVDKRLSHRTVAGAEPAAIQQLSSASPTNNAPQEGSCPCVHGKHALLSLCTTQAWIPHTDLMLTLPRLWSHRDGSPAARLLSTGAVEVVNTCSFLRQGLFLTCCV